jgi:DEAD/DEAH box helicase domain-containing protein
MFDHVVVDVEIQKTIEETPGGWDATDKLGVACAVVYECQTDRFRIYGPQDVPALQDRLLAADRISGFNIWKFDFPVIWGVPGRERVMPLLGKTNDLLRRIWQGLGLDVDTFSSAHKGWGLDAVVRGTLAAPGKIANGAQAPRWFQAGEWGKLVNYCVDDVTLERDLADFVDKYGFVVNGDSGQVVRLPRYETPVS